MTNQRTTHCPRCGVEIPQDSCARCADPEPAPFDREGDAIWEPLPRFCVRCGDRLQGVREPHACPPPVIHFYSVAGEFGEFSNFARFPIQLDGKRWPTSEHYFQAQKFAGTEHEECVRQARTAGKAAKLGRDRSRPLRRDWEAVKVDVMRRALRAKFTQHDGLRALLTSTGDAKLVEHTTHDAFWGDGGGHGKNWLGRLLMELRAELAER